METLFDLSPMIMAIVPLVVGLVEVIKRAIGMSSRYAPLLSILLGIGGIALTGVAWQAMIVQGIIAGLTASGLYAGTKASVGR